MFQNGSPNAPLPSTKRQIFCFFSHKAAVSPFHTHACTLVKSHRSSNNKVSQLWHLLLHDRCISFWVDDILWHYHQKSNNKISILEPSPHAKSNHLPLNGNRVGSKQSVTACPLILTRPLPWQTVRIFTWYEQWSAELNANYLKGPWVNRLTPLKK